LLNAGGKIVAIKDDPDVLEGAWRGTRLVIIEFESVDAAVAWYQSPEYQEMIALRAPFADVSVVVVEGNGG
jgi:uncharacterized protein (DUF1330 family)